MAAANLPQLSQPNPFVEVYMHNTNGRALRTHVDVDPGQKIFQGRLPLLSINTNILYTEWDKHDSAQAKTWWNAEKDEAMQGRGRVLTQVGMLNANDQQAFRQLYSDTARNQAHDVNLADYERILHNSWGYKANDPTNANREVAFLRTWKDLTFMNHSCRPNATLSVDQTNGAVDVIATKTIPAGADFEINYIEVDGLAGWSTRQNLLNKGWGFKCQCVDCVVATKKDGVDLRHIIGPSIRTCKILIASVTTNDGVVHLDQLSQSNRIKLNGQLEQSLDLVDEIEGKTQV